MKRSLNIIMITLFALFLMSGMASAQTEIMSYGDFTGVTLGNDEEIDTNWILGTHSLNHWYTYQLSNNKAFYEIDAGGFAKVSSDASDIFEPKKLLYVLEAPGKGDYTFSFDYKLDDVGQQYSVVRIYGIKSTTNFTINMSGVDSGAGGITAADKLISDPANGWPSTGGNWVTESTTITGADYDYFAIYATFSDGQTDKGLTAWLDNFSLLYTPAATVPDTTAPTITYADGTAVDGSSQEVTENGVLPLSVKISDTNDDNETVPIAGTSPVTANFADPVSNVTSTFDVNGNGTITITPVADVTADTNATITLTVTDDSGNSAEVSFTLTVKDTVGSAPVITDPGAKVIPQNETSTISITVTDAEGMTGVTLTPTVSTNTVVIPLENIVAPDAATDNIFDLAITPATDQTGTTDITLVAKDSDNNTSSLTFSVTVEVVTLNEPPVFNGPPNKLLEINSDPVTIDFTVQDSDSTTLTITKESSSNETLFPLDTNITLTEVSLGNYQITVTPVADKTGISEITLKADDGDGNAVSKAFTVMVSDSDAQTDSPYVGVPPFIVEIGTKANVLIILDNSNSMDEDANGTLWKAEDSTEVDVPVYGEECVPNEDGTGGDGDAGLNCKSRSQIARKAVRKIIDDYGDELRIGLMAYRQNTGGSLYNVCNAPYFVSYNSSSYYKNDSTYDPSDPNDEGDANSQLKEDYFLPMDQTKNTQRFEYASGQYVYYDISLPYYGCSGTTGFMYSTRYKDLAEPSTASVSTYNAEHIKACGGNCLDGYDETVAGYCETSQKDGTSDIYPDGSETAADQAAMSEYGACIKTTCPNLTDSDVASGFWQVGAQWMYVYAGKAWVTSSENSGGMLHVSVNDVVGTDGAVIDAQYDALMNKLGPNPLSGFNEATSPIRNLGFTPLRTVLEDAKKYFAGTLSGNNAISGISADSPIQYECQKNYVVLVTDGLSTENNPETAAASLLTGVTVDGETYPIKTYVLGFALPRNAKGESGKGKLDPLAKAGGTNQAYYADNPDELAQALAEIFGGLGGGKTSGTAASVLADSGEGEGAIFQASFEPLREDEMGNRVAWPGDIYGLFLDEDGYTRESVIESDGTQILDTTSDQIITMCYDTGKGVFRFNKYNDDGEVPDANVIEACDATDFPYPNETVTSINYLWSAGEWLAGLTDTQAEAQRTYTSSAKGRYIFTAFGGSGAGSVAINQSVQKDFLPSNFNNLEGLLQAWDASEAAAIVNFTRGVDQPFYRNRQIDVNEDGSLETDGSETWRLGDCIYSTPTTVAAPAENFDLLYKDSSYREFYLEYKDRRQVVYAGANDGMLHAFNAGWYDEDEKKFYKGKPADGTDPAETQYELGSELWAYVPYNLLPSLKYLTSEDYGESNHIYGVDGKPRIFDAQIFSEVGGVDGQPGDVHINGWGTVLVCGMRLGGGWFEVDADPGTGEDLREMRSAYIIMDITDPEQPPKLLLEFTHANLGYTTSIPTPAKIKGADNTADGWYLVLGSGPYPTGTDTGYTDSFDNAASTQNAHLFLLNLKTMQLDSSFGSGGVMELGNSASNGFVSDIVAADYDLSETVNAVYFGTVTGGTGSWSGDLWRIVYDEEKTQSWDNTAGVFLGVNQPVTAGPAISIAGSYGWVYFGTGRYIVDDDIFDTQSHTFYGVKEPVDNNGDFTWAPNATNKMKDVTGYTLYKGSPIVYDSTGTDTGYTFATLEDEILEGDGWYLNLTQSATDEASERNLSQATVLGNVVTFTTFKPATEVCQSEGISYLYALYATTGTAYTTPIIGVDTSSTKDGMPEVLKVVSLGAGMASTPSLSSAKTNANGGSSVQSHILKKSILVTIPQTVVSDVANSKLSWEEFTTWDECE